MGDYIVTTIGGIKGDTRSLDYGLHGSRARSISTTQAAHAMSLET